MEDICFVLDGGSDLPIKRKTSRGGEVLELENYATVTF